VVIMSIDQTLLSTNGHLFGHTNSGYLLPTKNSPADQADFFFFANTID